SIPLFNANSKSSSSVAFSNLHKIKLLLLSNTLLNKLIFLNSFIKNSLSIIFTFKDFLIYSLSSNKYFNDTAANVFIFQGNCFSLSLLNIFLSELIAHPNLIPGNAKYFVIALIIIKAL